MKYTHKYKRGSQFLTKQQIENMINQNKQYIALDILPTKHIVINWEASLSSNQDIQKECSKLLRSMREWHKHHKLPFAYIWVLENGAQPVGIHMHMILYSDNNAFENLDHMITRWLSFQRDPVNVKNANVYVEPATYIDGLIGYICKGLHKMESPLLKNHHSYQGRINGNRWGYCRKPIIPKE